ncbi:MAG: nucleoside-triphosphate diphosphatase [Pseudolactococcus laudensis]|uniref:dITP/XTP pyrophosphatase n=1 Tax=Pseudolactococcus laudensis TaxID=1494461 RepID=A0A7V8N1G1_9LACT|nr:nucleoside-triphosphate diphosphatase [Lactococcus laudensis]MBA0016895.1 nucleoside-triphosphate diphosphatase [Lactococcus laudensis]MBR2762990.1 nucleoside-triphosphate diphosphatase [Lactococcus sp.]MBW9281627.1 nucleoside-triphosphate diphosphatase [Lactococcus laudensis]
MKKLYKHQTTDIFAYVLEEQRALVIENIFGEQLEIPLYSVFFKYFPAEKGLKIVAVDETPADVIDLFFQVLRDVTGLAYQYSIGQVLTVELEGQVLHTETVSLQSKTRKTLLIATRNEGKTREFKAMFSQLGYDIKNLNDFPELPEVAETGMTFEENARLKAETISELTGEMVLADDSGLMVDVLGGLPGVWSARFAGEHATDAANNAKLLHELASTAVSPEKRKAKFHTTLVVAAPGKSSLVVEGEWPGSIATIPRGDDGFGYDPLFVDEETGRTAAQMTLEQKNKVSHRARALQNLLKEWPEWLRQ